MGDDRREDHDRLRDFGHRLRLRAGIDHEIDPKDTPDGRPGVRILLFAMSSKDAEKQLVNRLGQCVLTCPGTAVFSTVEGAFEIKVGDAVRQFGDKWQISKVIDGRRYWRVPVMDGEFLCEGKVGLTKKSVGGGNLLVMGSDWESTMRATEAGVDAIAGVRDAITPFPGGIVRSARRSARNTRAWAPPPMTPIARR